ncbi:MAG: hypothetical protein DRI71_12020, partial [Bacteroidetes bacterium]
MIKLNKVLKAAVVFGVATALVFSCQTQMEKVGPEVFSETSNLVTGTPIAGQYIVVYRSGAMSAARVSRDYSSRQEFMALKTVDFLQGHNIQKEAILNVYGNVLEGFTAKLDAEIMTKAKKLKLLVHAAGSVKPVVSDDLFARDVKVTSAAAAIAYGVAEFCLGMILMAPKRAFWAAQAVKDGSWSEGIEVFGGPFEIYGQKIGIIGASHVGRYLIKLLKSFTCDILLYDPYLSVEQ